jgi:hypothetical protein
MSFAAALAAIGEAGAAVGSALGIGGEAAGAAGAGAGGVLGAGSGAAGGAGFGGLASSGGLLDSLGGALGTVKGLSNNNPNSGMVGGSQEQQNPMMSQMMQQAMQQPTQQPYKKVEFDPLPWQHQAGDIVKRREGQTGQMNLSGLLGMLTNGSLPMHSIEDTGGSGAGGTTGGLVKGILSKL